MNRTDVHNRLQTQLPFFAKHALVIKDKNGKLIPFLLNKAQKYLHSCLEKQLADKGYVRALVLKGRQLIIKFRLKIPKIVLTFPSSIL